MYWQTLWFGAPCLVRSASRGVLPSDQFAMDRGNRGATDGNNFEECQAASRYGCKGGARERCGARECRLDVAVAHDDDGGDIAREVAVCGRSIGPRGFAAVADRRRRLEVHVDGCGGVFREIAIVCDRDRDGLTDIAHF